MMIRFYFLIVVFIRSLIRRHIQVFPHAAQARGVALINRLFRRQAAHFAFIVDEVASGDVKEFAIAIGRDHDHHVRGNLVTGLGVLDLERRRMRQRSRQAQSARD